MDEEVSHFISAKTVDLAQAASHALGWAVPEPAGRSLKLISHVAKVCFCPAKLSSGADLPHCPLSAE